MGGPITYGADPKDWKQLIPKSVWIGLASMLAAGLLWHEAGWRGRVNSSTASIDAVERRLGVLEGKVQDQGKALDRSLDETKEIRLEQLKFYAWQAERQGENTKAAELRAKMIAVEAAKGTDIVVPAVSP